MEKITNFAPFYSGQKIVRIGKSNKYVKKGKTYTCESCYQCPICKTWYVNILECPLGDKSNFETSSSCGYTFDFVTGYMNGRSDLFAPIEEKFESISYAKVLKKEAPLISVN